MPYGAWPSTVPARGSPPRQLSIGVTRVPLFMSKKRATKSEKPIRHLDPKDEVTLVYENLSAVRKWPVDKC